MSPRAGSPGRIVVSIFFGISLLTAACSTHSVPPRGSGGGQEKVVICHKGKKTLTLPVPAARAHLDHGDTEGPCG